jgi:hypothetical protein
MGTVECMVRRRRGEAGKVLWNETDVDDDLGDSMESRS